MSKVFIVWGGWDGYEFEQVVVIFECILKEEQFEVEVFNILEVYVDVDKLLGFDLIVFLWMMGQIEQELVNNVLVVVQSGVGFVGIYGGMCDVFWNNVDWQFMIGG